MVGSLGEELMRNGSSLISLDLSNLSLDVTGMLSPVGARLGQEDLDFTVVEVEGEKATFDGNAVGGVENVTKPLTL
jgi:hypothetical protein